MDDNNRTLYVANLGSEVTEALLRELFLQAGPIEKVRLTVINGVPKNFAHIIYLHECSTIYATQIFQGTKLHNKELVLKPNNSARDSGTGQSNYQPREERDDFFPTRRNQNQYTPYRDERRNYRGEERYERPRDHYRNDRPSYGNQYRENEQSRSHDRHHHRNDRHGYHQDKPRHQRF